MMRLKHGSMTTALAAMLWLGLSCMPCAPGIADTTAAEQEPERIEKLKPARVVPVINPQRHGYLTLDDYFRLALDPFQQQALFRRERWSIWSRVMAQRWY